MHKLMSWMGIQRGEEQLAGLSIAYALFLGLAKAWMLTVPVTLFLMRFNIMTLPYVYIASALVLIILGIIYNVVENKWAVTRLFYIFISLPTVAFFILWILLQSFPGKWLYPALLMCAFASVDICDLELWKMLNRLFTLDQSKRMFGTISASQILAMITGNLLVPFLFVFTGPNTLILGISLCIMCAMFLLDMILRKYPRRFKHQPSRALVQDNQTKESRNTYLIYIMLFAFISSFVFTIVELSFFNINKKVFLTEVQLASFLGIFFALLTSFQFLCSGLIAPLVLNRLGVKAALLLRPILVGSATLVLLLFLPLHINFYSIFLLIALIKLLDTGLAYSTYGQAILILYQPLFPQLRSWFQSTVELFIFPLTTITASVVFILIQHYLNSNLVFISFLILIAISGALRMTFVLQKGYVNRLKQAIAKQLVVFRNKILDKNSAIFLLENLKHGKPHEIVYCLHLLEQADPSYFVQGLEFCLAHPHPLIKRAALVQLQHVHSNALTPKIKNILLDSTDPTVQALAFCALLFHKALDIELHSYIDSKDVVLSDGAILAALKYSINSPFQQNARKRLHTLIHSPSSHERLRAAKILGQLEHEAIPDLLLLFEDRDPSVVIAVIEHIPAFQEIKLYQKLAHALRRDELRLPATRAFTKAKDQGLPALAEALQRQDPYPLVTTIGCLQTPAAAQLLLQILRTSIDHTFQWHILHALDHCGYQANTETEKQELAPFFNEVLDHLHRLLNWRQQLGSEYALLTATLIRQMQSLQKRIFLLFGLCYPKNVIHDIAFYFKHDDLDKVSYARELLENILEKNHKYLLVPLFKEYDPDAPLHSPPIPDRKSFIDSNLNPVVESERKAGLEKRGQVHENFCSQGVDVASLFEEMLADPQTPLLKATILYLIARHQLNSLTHCAQDAVNDRNAMVSETATWALTNLNKGML